MGLIVLEALGALLILVGIVWWTMFSGRKNGEIDADARSAPSPAAPAPAAMPGKAEALPKEP